MSVTRPTALHLDEEQRIDLSGADEERRRTYLRLVERLSRQSVDKHFDPFVDIDWDAPDNAIEPDDPRWILPDTDPLGATAWYRSQPDAVRARIGLYGVCHAMRTGLQFENVLKRGLLEYAYLLPNGDPEFRYVYHEVIEEAHHGLMFQEFVNRSGTDPRGISAFRRWQSRRVVLMGRRFPELFFLFVLGGEDPIDWVQRDAARHRDLPPIIASVIRIHVTEEARHLSFARHFLKQHTASLPRHRRLAMAVVTPVMLAEMATMMLGVPADQRRRFGIPAAVVREATSRRNPLATARLHASLAKVARLCEELGVLNRWTRPLWRALGLIP